MATRLETKEIMDNPNAIATTGGAEKHELKQVQTKDSLRNDGLIDGLEPAID